MWSKKKLSKEILGLTGAAFIVAVFVFGFIRVASNTVVFAYCEKNGIGLSESIEMMLDTWVPSVSFVAAVVIFIVLFLFLVGEKIEQAVTEIVAKEVQLREEREQLVRSLSHDIRTPLTSICHIQNIWQKKKGSRRMRRKSTPHLWCKKQSRLKI